MPSALDIVRVGRRGDGVAVLDGDRVLVERALPGELVSGKIDAGRIRTPTILRASPERVEAACPHYSACGGCALMHASDAWVAAWKTSVVEGALTAQGIDARVGAVQTSPLASRRRATFALKPDGTVGFHARASTRVVDLTTCLVCHPAIVAALPALRRLAQLPEAPVSVTVTSGPSGLDVFADGGIPDIIAMAELAQANNWARFAWGAETLTLRTPTQKIGPAHVTPPPGAFLQATAHGQSALTAAVTSILRPSRHVVDLFAGCGTFSLPLATRARVHAVEGLAAPLEALDAAARGTPALNPVTTETRDLAARPLLPHELARYDGAVMDPPRAGAAAQTRAIAESDLKRLAYVSCDPVSFARDAAFLTKAGFTLKGLAVIDQFRYSPHLEVVGAFLR